MTQAEESVAEIARLPQIRDGVEWLRKQRPWINDQHFKLCRVPAATFFEAERARWMAGEFTRLGWEARTDRAGNVIASRPGQGNRATVAVTAHLDTVLAPRLPDDISVNPIDGRFCGPGVSDNGAGLAALLALAGMWNAAPGFAELANSAPLTPILVANVGEEGEGNLSGMRYLCRNAQPQTPSTDFKVPSAFLILDGPGHEHITCRALVSRRFEIGVQGPGGHSWSDHGTGNPVHALSRAVVLFTEAMSTDSAAEKGRSGSRSSYNFGLMQGGSSVNSIPVEAWAKVDLRSEDPTRMDAMAAFLQEALERAVAQENTQVVKVSGGQGASRGPARTVTGRIKEIGSRPGGDLPDHAPILESIRAVDALLGIRSYLDRSSTDANIPLSLGLPAIAIGAGGQGGGAHTTGEWYHPEGREIGLRRILLTLCSLLKVPATGRY